SVFLIFFLYLYLNPNFESNPTNFIVNQLLAYRETMATHTTILPILLFFILSSSSILCSSLDQAHLMVLQTLNNVTDHASLLSFKSYITNDPHNALSGWNTSSSFCTWKGVTCNSTTQRVVAIDLSNLDLQGSITPRVGNLSFLQALYLQNNSFRGNIPSEVGNLYRLHTLNLNTNLLQGSIPSSIGLCSSLTALDLSSNRLEGVIPSQLAGLSKIRNLSVGDNHLTGTIPPSLGNLSFMENLILFKNSIRGALPSELGQLHKLLKLQVGQNNITGEIPSSIFNLSSLVELGLASNLISGSLPTNLFSTLHELNTLFVGGNALVGSIPASLSNASMLQRLDLGYNSFSGQIPHLGNLPRIQILSLQYNQLINSGRGGMDFVKSLSNSTQLQVFSVAGNRLTGMLPSSIGNLSSQLSLMVFAENELEGSIPEEIGNLNGLTLLSLEYNAFSGSFPDSIGKIPNLQQVFADGNMFDRSIPESLGNLSLLFHVSLSQNNFTGRIPSSLGNCKSLTMLDLSVNNLSGDIPKEILNIPSFAQVLNLSWNSLSGSVPAEIGTMKAISQIDLSAQFPIPNSLGNLKGMEYLDLSSNKLSGKIPASLQSLKFLKFMNLSMNDLQGEVPKAGIFMNLTSAFLMGNDKLCGGLPQLKLPNCTIPRRHSNGTKKNLIIALTASAASLISFSLFIVLIMMWRKKQASLSQSDVVISFEGPHRMYTYFDLRNATNNFCSENLIGEGSFGCVYRGLMRDGSHVAVKVFNIEQHGAGKSFTAECEALRNVRHRNLVKILTACSSSEFKALVLQFMSNGSLEKWLHSKSIEKLQRLDFKHRIEIARDVASAMEYLHHDCENPIVHCDLKPSNVLLDEDMVAHVGDFGLARLLPNPTEVHGYISSTLGLKGSIGYIPPEYGQGLGVSTRGDVYSYGILLLEMFTGKRPTDDLFKETLSLQKWVSQAFPDGVYEVADTELLMKEGGLKKETLVSVFQVGLLCTAEAAEDRPDMRQVSAMLKHIAE
ncbi:probable LRR receptor-like serine/threonine-protein kinase At3g47570, partial [Nymphaea colorata]